MMVVVMAHSSQTKTVGKVDGQFLHVRWWLQRSILDVHPLPHFRQAKDWDEDGRDAACSFCLLRFFLLAFSASCVFPLRLYASLPRTHNRHFSVMSASCLGLRPPAAVIDG